MNNSRKKVIDTLESMNIKYDIIEHPAVYTIDEIDELNYDTNNGLSPYNGVKRKII